MQDQDPSTFPPKPPVYRELSDVAKPLVKRLIVNAALMGIITPEEATKRLRDRGLVNE